MNRKDRSSGSRGKVGGDAKDGPNPRSAHDRGAGPPAQGPSVSGRGNVGGVQLTGHNPPSTDDRSTGLPPQAPSQYSVGNIGGTRVSTGPNPASAHDRGATGLNLGGTASLVQPSASLLAQSNTSGVASAPPSFSSGVNWASIAKKTSAAVPSICKLKTTVAVSSLPNMKDEKQIASDLKLSLFAPHENRSVRWTAEITGSKGSASATTAEGPQSAKTIRTPQSLHSTKAKKSKVPELAPSATPGKTAQVPQSAKIDKKTIFLHSTDVKKTEVPQSAPSAAPGVTTCVPQSALVPKTQSSNTVDTAQSVHLIQEKKAQATNDTQFATSTAKDKIGESSRSNAKIKSNSSAPTEVTDSQTNEKPQPDSVLGPQFVKFLKTYTKPGERCALYTSQPPVMHMRGHYCITVDFNHMIEDFREVIENEKTIAEEKTKYLDLVLRIGNDPSNSWLNPFVVSFILEELKKDNAAYEEFSKIVETGSKGIFATFENKPSKIEKLAVALTDRHHPLKRHIIALGRDISRPAATTRGRVIFRAALSELLGIFRLDQWFASKLTSDDFLLLDSVRCMILKKPSSIPPLEGTWLLSKASSKKFDHDMYTWKASNLSDLWGFMEEHYKDDKGELCMYFDPLKFEMTRASSKVQKGWFLDYVENMQALKSSMARKQFVCESAKVYKMAGVVDNEHLKAALDNKPRIVQDWRNTIMNSNDFLLQHCFWHGIKLEKLVHLMSGIHAAVEKGQYGRIPEECYHAARENTVGAIIEYKRNLIQHLIETFLKEKREEHANENKSKGKDKDEENKGKIHDVDEIELFASSVVPEIEHAILEVLMQHDREIKMLTSIVSAYVAATSDEKDLPRR